MEIPLKILQDALQQQTSHCLIAAHADTPSMLSVAEEHRPNVTQQISEKRTL